MKRSTIEKKLNEAMERKVSALSSEYHLDGQIKYHDSEATRLRKQRQAARSKKDRAELAIINLSQALAKATE
jgi:hypothetical protein